MKLLIDSCVWGGLQQVLIEAGHDAVAVAQWSEDPGDEEILARAYNEGRIIVTRDKDFAELSILRKLAHNGIIRLVKLPGKEQGPACLEVLANYATELEAKAIITAEPGRIRIRKSQTEQGNGIADP